MNEDIICLLQDLGRENAIDVIANFIIRNPDLEDSIAAKMGALMATSMEPTRVIPGPNSGESSPPAQTFLSQILNTNLADYLPPSLQKMVFVVNMDLDMGRGKQCAQVAHAAVGLYMKIKDSRKTDMINKLQYWISLGQKKIVVRGNDVEHLNELKSKAEALNIPALVVTDAGCTQIAPGSKTVLALFGSDEELQPITGSLRLL